jgi:cell division protein FtsQ
VAARKNGPARALALPAPKRLFDARRLLPGGRSLVVALGLVALAAAAYAAALETSVFAVRSLEIVGGSPRVQAQVRAALAPEVGRSLLRVSGADIDRRAAAIPDVISLEFDRSFPHTLRVRVVAEHAVLLLRRGRDSWVVSARGRVMRKIANPGRSSLARFWVPKGTGIKVGATVGLASGGLAAAALAPIAAGAFPKDVRLVRQGAAELTLVMRSGLEIRLGTIGDLRLKLAIARRILRLSGAAAGAGSYIDVSVPERPVLGSINSQVATGG